MDESELSNVRRAFARKVVETAHINDVRFENAFAEVHREDFLPPPPWRVFTPANGWYEVTTDDDPVHVYQDKTIGIIPEKGLNNGQPHFLAFLIALAQPKEGDRFVHVGAGTGYYTAIIAHLVGASGSVRAIEFEPELAERARENLSELPNVSVIAGDGTAIPLDAADAILVNAGASRPEAVWLDALQDGGRLVLPLTVPFTTPDGHKMTFGSIFVIERSGDAFSARWASTTAIYPCAGRDQSTEAALGAAFAAGGAEKVTRLFRTDDIPDERCWVRGKGWSLAFH